MEDTGFNFIAADESPCAGITEAGPDFAIGKVDKDGLIVVRGDVGGVPVDLRGHLSREFKSLALVL